MDERKELNLAIKSLKKAKKHMKNAFGFDQLCTGHGSDLYGEAIDRMINGIKGYQNREE